MRASELIDQLQQIMEDHHCDPEIEVQTGLDTLSRYKGEVKIETENAWYCQKVRRGAHINVVIRNDLNVPPGLIERT